jgi:very-short-patch-repair endonuclease
MQRQQFLESMGLTVISFNDADVKVDLNNVLMAIEGWLEEQPPAPLF